MHRGLRCAVAISILAALVAGCGTEPDPIPAGTPAAGFEDLGIPWQPRPFAVVPEVVAAAEEFCRSNPAPAIPAAFPLRIVDARGGGRLILLFAGSGRGFGECQLRTTARGFRGQGGGVQDVDDPLAIQPGEVQVVGGGGGTGALPGDDYSYVMGHAGEQVRQVVVTIDGGRQAVASLRDGWYVAWWPGRESRRSVVGYDAAGNLVGEARIP